MFKIPFQFGLAIKVVSKITKPFGVKLLKPVGKLLKLIGKRSVDDLEIDNKMKNTSLLHL